MLERIDRSRRTRRDGRDDRAVTQGHHARPDRRRPLPVRRGHARPARRRSSGAHVRADGTSFAVWAPNAERVSVIGDFNGWDAASDPLAPVAILRDLVGRTSRGARAGHAYKFHIRSRHAGYRVDKADPFAFRAETPPKTGSIVWDLAYDWGDAEWLASRARSGTRCPRRCRSTRSTSARGAADPTSGWLELPRPRAAARRPRARPRLHPRRAAAGHGAPVLRLVGLPDDRLLRADRHGSARRRT